MSGALVWLAIGVVGGGGALGRFMLDGAVSRRLGRAFPFGTLVVNATGAFALGVLVGAAAGGDTYRLAGTALLGAYTTFSTWMLETHRLGEDGELALGWLNLAGSVALGLLCAALGRALGEAL